MTIEKLRTLHPRLVYQSYAATRDNNHLVVTYSYLLEPDIELRSTFRLPCPTSVDTSLIDTFLFQIGMVEAISYWKLACPQELLVVAGALSKEDVQFFKTLFLYGLGEFYYMNAIDFTPSEFFTITPTKTRENDPIEVVTKATDLVLIGGGKDSALLLSLLSKSHKSIQPLVINPSTASLETIKTLGYQSPLVVTRSLDPMLKTLNTKGYLNGHTPFSALLSFIGVTVAAMNGYENVVVANEQSANEGNVVYKGVEVNHQYSKSLQYENLFRSHYKASITESVSYFSAMRGFNDIQIAKMFARERALLPVFRSCNKLRSTNDWCGECAKCAFTYLTLFPFVSHDQMTSIFGADYFTKPVIIEFISELIGITPVKPFECVGTRDETKLALLLSLEVYVREKREVPEGLLRLKIEAQLVSEDIVELSARVLDHIDTNTNLPDEYTTILASAWKVTQEHI